MSFDKKDRYKVKDIDMDIDMDKDKDKDKDKNKLKPKPGPKPKPISKTKNKDKDKDKDDEEKNPIDENFGAVQIMKKANEVQDKNLESLKRTLHTAVEIKETGNEVAITLAKQGEKIGQTEREMATLSSETERAKRDVMWFFRNLAKDRCCVIIIALIVFGIAGVIFASLYSKKMGIGSSGSGSSSSNSNTTVAPQ